MAETWSKVTKTRPKFTSSSLRILRGNSRFVCNKARRELGYTTRPLEETIQDAVDWFKANKLL